MGLGDGVTRGAFESWHGSCGLKWWSFPLLDAAKRATKDDRVISCASRNGIGPEIQIKESNAKGAREPAKGALRGAQNAQYQTCKMMLSKPMFAVTEIKNGKFKNRMDRSYF